MDDRGLGLDRGAANDAFEEFAKFVGVDGFYEGVFEAEFASAGFVRHAHGGGEEHDGGEFFVFIFVFFGALFFFDLGGESEGVAIGYVGVEENEAEGAFGFVGDFEDVDEGAGFFEGGGFEAPGGEELVEPAGVGLVVVGNEDREVGELFGFFGGLFFAAEGDGEVQGGAGFFAFDPKFSAEEVGGAGGEDESEAGADFFEAGGGLDHEEDLLDVREFGFGEPAGVIAHGEMEFGAAGEAWVAVGVFAGFDGDDDVAAGGHFDGEGDEVGECLEEAAAIADDHGGEVGSGLADEFEAFVFGSGGETAHGLVEAVDEVEWKDFKLELARFHFGEFVEVASEFEP